MTRTVDLVIVGLTDAGSAAAVDAARRGERVLVVSDARDTSPFRGLRRALKAAGTGCSERVSLLAGVEIVSIDGKNAVEVVLLRQIKTGRLLGINTSHVILTMPLPDHVVSPALRALVLAGSTG